MQNLLCCENTENDDDNFYVNPIKTGIILDIDRGGSHWGGEEIDGGHIGEERRWMGGHIFIPNIQT